MTTKLPLTGSKSLAKNWQKFCNIFRFGKVIKEVTREPVQQVSLLFEPELSKDLDAHGQEQVALICTEGAPSCTMRLRAGADGKDETRSGPLFQLQVVVQTQPGKQIQDSRNVCFSQGLALLERQIKEGRIVENSRFLACSKRYIKLRDVEALADEQLAAAAAKPAMEEPEKALKASAFRWQGRGSVVAAESTAFHETLSSLGDGNTHVHAVPATFKWCMKGSVPTTSSAAATPGVGQKRGREDGDTEAEETSRKRPAKSIKIGPIGVQ